MNTLTKSVLLITTTASLLLLSINAKANSNNYIENALIDVCKSVQKGQLSDYRKTAKAYRLKDKTIALKVMCNGDNVIDFAEKNNSYKIAARLQNSIRDVNTGDVSISDVAAINPINNQANDKINITSAE